MNNSTTHRKKVECKTKMVYIMHDMQNEPNIYGSNKHKQKLLF